MIYRTPLTKINDYYANDSISQSHLKLYMRGWDYYQRYMQERNVPEKYFDEPKDHFLIGSALDCKMLHAPEDFGNTYYISNLMKKPSDTEISIIWFVFDKVVKKYMEDFPGFEFVPAVIGDIVKYPELLTEAFVLHNYYPAWGYEAKVKKFSTPDTVAYWDELFKSYGKQILTIEDMTLISQMETTLKTSFATSFLFDDRNQDVDIFYQLPIYTTINHLPVKGLIDIVVVDHDARKIWLYDLKTMQESACSFPYEYKKRNYGLQGAFYFEITKRISIHIRNLHQNDRTSMITSDYTIEDFRFAVVSKSFASSDALLFNMGKVELENIIHGKSQSYFHSTDESGVFHEHVNQRKLSIAEQVGMFHNSKIINKDCRYYSDDSLLISNFV